jgi:hypothetical protein
MKFGFLENKEAEFLDHMLKKYEINYLDWSYRTRWLKGEIQRMSQQLEKRQNPYMQLDMFEKKERKYAVPCELLAGMQSKQTGVCR